LLDEQADLMDGSEVETREISIPSDLHGERLDRALAVLLPEFSRSYSQQLLSEGCVSCLSPTPRLMSKASGKVRMGERYQLILKPTPQSQAFKPESIPLNVIYEDQDLRVLFKPAGLVVHPAPGNWSGTLVNALLGRGQALAAGGGTERVGLVHRLDKETSGLLIVAKTDRAHTVLSGALAARTITRRYAALCWGHLDADEVRVDQPLGRDPNDRTRVAIRRDGRQARTDFHRLARFDSCDLLRAHLHTGRTHQIRVHLASIGHPVVGDDTYGGGGGRKLVALPPKRHFLHAAWLVFPHPVTGAPVELRSPLPEDLRHCLRAVAGDPVWAADEDPLEALGFYAGGAGA